MGANATLNFATPDDSEELAQAEMYGLLARLWLAPPDADLLQQFSLAVTQAPEAGALLGEPWQALVAACRARTLQTEAQEFDALFQGVGKPEVFVYASLYLAGFLNEKPPAQLPTDLAALGLTRDAGTTETEDQIAYLCEVMRYLITRDDVAVCNLEQQRRFFRAHRRPWVHELCDALQAQPRARLWAALAGLTRQFMAIQTQAFGLLEA